MEVIEKRTHNSKTYLNEDGTYTTKIHSGDVHYFDGEYKEIDLNIKRETNWEFEYALRDNRFRAYFNDSTDIENDTLAGFELINSNGVARWVNFKLLGASPDSSGYYGNTYTYHNVMQNVDLEYTVSPQKLKENIIAHDPSALQVFTFTIKMDAGLRFETQADGSVFFMDNDTGEKLWEIAAPFAIDAEGNRTEDVAYLFGKQTYAGIEYDSVTVEIKDCVFLENAVYPIEIDPTVTVGSTDIQDARVTLEFPNDNYGQDDSVRVGVFDGTLTNRGFFQFDISSIPTDSIVIDASFNAYALSSGYSDVFTLHEVLSAWDESIITSGNAPPFSDAFSQYNNEGTSGWKAFDVSTPVQKWVDGQENNGLMIKAQDETVSGTNQIALNSSENPSEKPFVEITYNQTPSTPTLTTPNGGETWNAQHTIEWGASTDAEGNSLTYQIQISTDNGATWNNVVASTTGTTYAYDFSTTPETSIALIRIRAYDGTSYSAWDQSDGVFAINHNNIPESPDNLSPSGTSIDRSVIQRLSWNHNDQDGQTKADVQWRLQGNATWNDITVNSSNQYVDVNSNTFPAGAIEWRVRTYDTYGAVSPYSIVTVFTAANPSNAPTITAPTDPVSVSRPTIEWNASDQQSYQIIIEDGLNTVVWDTGEVISINRARTIGIDLINGGAYTIRVRVRNQAGLLTEYAETTVTVSYTPPAEPVLDVYADTSFIRLEIDNPTPSGTQPTVSSNDVYKRSNGEWYKVANVTDVYYDYAVKSGQEYEYRITANGDNNTTSQSNIKSQSISLIGTWMHDVYDPQATLHHFLIDVEGRGRTRSKDTVLRQFSGRTSPVAETTNNRRANVEVSLLLRNDAEYQAFERIFESSVICYRDGRGRLEYGVMIEEPIEDEQGGMYRVDFTLNRIDYSEVIE